jgi:DnaK suppressor protein
MEEDVRRCFLEQLNAKKRTAENVLERLLQNQKDCTDQVFSNTTADETENAQREILLYRSFSLIEKKAHEVNQLSRLIRKAMRDEDFGTCEECGDPIPAERLLVIPDATLCINCQRDLEKFQHRKGITPKRRSIEGEFPAEQDDEFSDLDILQYDLMDEELDIFKPSGGAVQESRTTPKGNRIPATLK